MFTVYTGERVQLRPFADFDEFKGLVREIHGALIPGWGDLWRPGRLYEDSWDKTGLLDHERVLFAIQRLDTGELAGYEVAIFPPVQRMTCWIGTLVRAAHQRRGIGIEAKQLLACYLFENYPIDGFEAITPSNHPRALKGMRMCCMREEGRIRCAEFSDGRWVDHVYFILTRVEWESMEYRSKVKRGV